MKTSKRLLLLAVAFSMALGLSAQNLYDASGGRIIGSITGNDIRDASGGYILAQFDGGRVMDYNTGRMLNRIESDGRVMDASGGRCVGRIESDGRVMDGSGGRRLGSVENGIVYGNNGKIIGKYNGISALRAAYYYFFFPKKGASPSAGKNPTTKPTTPAKPQVKKTVLYDRDKHPMGTLYGSDYFISTTSNGLRWDFKKTANGMTILRGGECFGTVGKDNKTIYYKNTNKIYGYVDEKGNAFFNTGEQFGVIRNDGWVYATSGLDMPFGYIADKNFDRHTVGLLYFVCYYSVLHNYYKEISKDK